MATLITDTFPEVTGYPADMPARWSTPTGRTGLSLHYAYLVSPPGAVSVEAVVHSAGTGGDGSLPYWGFGYRNDVYPGPNQWATVDVDLHGSGGVALRMSPDTGDCYWLMLNYGKTNLYLYRIIGGTATIIYQLINAYQLDTGSPATITLQAFGSTLSMYYGTAWAGVVIDSSLPDGRVGTVCAGNSFWHTDRGVGAKLASSPFLAGNIEGFDAPTLTSVTNYGYVNTIEWTD